MIQPTYTMQVIKAGQLSSKSVVFIAEHGSNSHLNSFQLQTAVIGKTDISASVLGLGTWAIGGDLWGGFNQKEAIATIKESLKLGVNLIDTAPIYGFGRAEEFLGKAIKGIRDEVVISTKCGLQWHSGDGTFVARFHGKDIYRTLHPNHLRKELENSLTRLNTDRIDIYYTHAQDKNTPLDDVVAILQQFKQEGKIRAIGASNLNLQQLQHYQDLGGIDAGQEEYNLLNRKIEAGIFPYCNSKKISMLAYCPIAQGLLTGKMTPSYHFNKKDMRRKMQSFSSNNLQKAEKLNEQLKSIAQRYNASNTQLALAWTIAQSSITHALCGARNITQLKENAKAASLIISPEDIKLMSQLAQQSQVTFAMHE